mgnify:CR=1 FL=1
MKVIDKKKNMKKLISIATLIFHQNAILAVPDIREPYTSGWDQHMIPREYITNIRYENPVGGTAGDPNFLEIEAAFDGYTNWDEDFYRNGVNPVTGNPWNANADDHNAIIKCEISLR